MNKFGDVLDEWVRQTPKGTLENTMLALRYLREKAIHAKDFREFLEMDSALSTIEDFALHHSTSEELRAFNESHCPRRN